MTMTISGRNVNDVFTDAVWYMRTLGTECLEHSRGGPVLVAPGPVVSEYRAPWERVLFDKRRDANPTFHLMESIWMLAGCEDVDWLLPFNSGMAKYANDGILRGAYGARWRKGFGVDQIRNVVNELRRDYKTRRAVISMWDPRQDMDPTLLDVPCNTTVYFDLRGGKLNMTVCCRSNDMFWGCYGANVVHFSILQEYVAGFLGAPMGVYRQFSNNFHIYTELPLWQEYVKMPSYLVQPYRVSGDTQWDNPFVVPLIQDKSEAGKFRDDCQRFVSGEKCVTNFMARVAEPMREAYLLRKKGDRAGVLRALERMPWCDWNRALSDWIDRRNDASK